jgi:hypothetical protein
MAKKLEDELDSSDQVSRHQDVLSVYLWYPRDEESRIKTIEVGLVDVRAADDIRISYDFARDGYVIKQAGKFEWDDADEEFDRDWQEVAFIKAWARKQAKDTP